MLDELRTEKRRTGTVATRTSPSTRVVGDRLANEPAAVRSPITTRRPRRARRPDCRRAGRGALVQLTPGQVERFLREMADDRYSLKTIRDTRSLLAGAIRRAERDGLVVRNVAPLADLPDAARKYSHSMTLAEVGTLLATDLAPWWRAYVTMGVQCGLRPGELLGLRWEDVDVAEDVIRVRRAVKVHGQPVIEDLKTERSRRTLAMPAAVASMLAAQRRDQAAARLRAAAEYRDHGLVLSRDDGRPCWPVTVRSKFRALCKRAGLGEGWHPHEQRHTFVSVLSHAGVDVDSIADAAGHINSNVTRTVYRHVLADKLSAAATVMDATFRASGGAS